MNHELRYCAARSPNDIDIEFLYQGLHEFPGRLNDAVGVFPSNFVEMMAGGPGVAARVPGDVARGPAPPTDVARPPLAAENKVDSKNFRNNLGEKESVWESECCLL